MRDPDAYAVVPLLAAAGLDGSARRDTATVVVDLAGRILSQLRASPAPTYVPTVRLALYRAALDRGEAPPSLADHNLAIDALVQDGRISVERVDGIGRVARIAERAETRP